jgi:mycothiol synthase
VRFTSRPCHYQADRERLLELIVAYRATSDLHAYPTTWRVRLLLTSRVWEPEHDTKIWENQSGQLIAMAMLWRRRPTSPYLVQEQFIQPSFLTNDLIFDMLGWGIHRAVMIAIHQKSPITLYTSAFGPSNNSSNLIKSYGFSPIPPDPLENNLYFSRSLNNDLPTPVLPPGYIIQSLRDTNEFAAYQSISSFAHVNPDHLREQFASDEYQHLVVIQPDGEFAAYCECSICQAEWQVSQVRIGWIDYIETRSEQQKQGLGQAVLLAGLAQLRDWGAETAMLVTISNNDPAVRLYEKVGFERVAVVEAQRYEKLIAE